MKGPVMSSSILASDPDLFDGWTPPEAVLQETKRVVEQMESFGVENSPERKLLAYRLCFDKRMSKVWKVLLQRNPTRQFCYPACIDALNPFPLAIEYLEDRSRVLKQMQDADSISEVRWMDQVIRQSKKDQRTAARKILKLNAVVRQQLACKSFYFAAFLSAAKSSVVYTKRDLQELVDSFQSTSTRLEQAAIDASILLKNEIPIDVELAVRELRKRAAFILANKSGKAFVERHRGDAVLRYFAIRMTAKARSLFGSPLYGTVAVAANVALDRRDLTGPRIRELVRD